MIKVQSNTATREPIPSFLRGLAPESLADLSWTDSALGVSDCAWWPEVNGDKPLPFGMQWGEEILKPDTKRKVVIVTHKIVPLTDQEIKKDLDTKKAAAIQLNNQAYQNAIRFMTQEYPEAEIATWERQREEVLAWELNKNASTPWIDIAAMARGLGRIDYLERTLAKVNKFAIISAYLTGRRQGIDDAIKRAINESELTNVQVDYSLPEGI